MKKIIKILIVAFVVVFALGLFSYSCNKGSISSPVVVSTTTTSTTSTTTTTTSKYVSEKELMEWLETQKGSFCSFGWVAHAADLPPVLYDDTRYLPITDTSSYDFFASVLDVCLDHLEDAASDLGTALSEEQARKINSDQTRYGLPAMPTYQAIKYLVEEANRNGSATLGSQYQFIAKRSFDYPFYNWSEVDTLVVYVDENQSAFDNSPIFYENVAIPANSFCLFRSITTSGGTRSTSYVFSSDQFQLSATNNGYMDFVVNPRSYYSSITAVTPDGTQSFSMVSDQGYNKGDFPVHVRNHNYNSIFDTTIVDFWNAYGENKLKVYMGNDLRILSGLECLYGKYANYNYSSPLMGSSDGCDWYVSAGYINSTDGKNDVYRDRFSYDSDHYSPEKAPVYVVDNDSPIGSGSTLTVNNVNDYADYGISYNSNTNEFELDVNVLAGLIAAEIIPKFQGTFDAVFEAQPEIGFGFDTALDLNMVDTSIDLVNNRVVSSGVWVPPSYPAVNTSIYIPADVPSYSTYAAATIPATYIDGAGDWLFFGYDLFDSLGLLIFVVPLVILALFWRFTGGD